MTQELIDYSDIDADELLKQKISINNVISAYQFNINSTANFERTVLAFEKEESLLHLSQLDGAFYLAKLGVDIQDAFSHVEYLFKLTVAEECLEQIWVAKLSVDEDDILDAAQSFENYQTHRYQDFQYHSFCLKNENSGELYAPIHFYFDEECIVIAPEKQLQAVFDNTATESYWPIESNFNLMHDVNIPNLDVYKEQGSRFVKSIDFDNELKHIQQLNYQIGRDDEVLTFNLQLTCANSFNAKKVAEQLFALKSEMLSKAKMILQYDFSTFVEAMNISQAHKSIHIEALLPHSLLTFLNQYLINSLPDLIEVFPQLMLHEFHPEPVEIEESIAENPAQYKQTYNVKTDFEPLAESSRLLDCGMQTGAEITSVGYLPESPKQLYIDICLWPCAPQSLRWQYNYLNFYVSNIKCKGETLAPVQYQTGNALYLGDNRNVTQRVVFAEGIKQKDLTNLTLHFELSEPKKVVTQRFAQGDLKQSTRLKSKWNKALTKFTLLAMENGSFTYNLVETSNTILEIRALNADNQALSYKGSSDRKQRYANGTACRCQQVYVAGDVHAVEVIYVEEFPPYPDEWQITLATPIVRKNIAESSNIEELYSSDFTELSRLLTVPTDSRHDPLPIDEFFEKEIDFTCKQQAGPFEIYFKGVSGYSGLDLNFYIKGPDLDIFKRNKTLLQLSLDEVMFQDDVRVKKEEKPANNSWDKAIQLFAISAFSRSSDTIATGITKEQASFTGVNGKLTVRVPEQLVKISLSALAVGDVIEQAGITMTVSKYEKDHFFIEGLDATKVVQVFARDSQIAHERIDVSNHSAEGSLMLGKIAEHEQYEIAIATSFQEYQFDFNF